MKVVIFKALVVALLFELCFSQTGIRLGKIICVDDENWVVNSDSTLGYNLDCSYYGTSSISVREAVLHFGNKLDGNNWRSSNFDRYNCNEDVGRFSAFRLNYTYSVQQECTNTLYKVTVGYNQGVKCMLRKDYLKADLFRLNRQVLQYETYAYPIPYALTIIYSCS